MREHAEAILKSDAEKTPVLPTEDVQKLLEELHVHQIELELQNKQLETAELELAASRDRYEALFDMAPTGYLTLDEHGYVLDTNRAAETMLGTESGTPSARHKFEEFVVPEDVDNWRHFRQDIFGSAGAHHCDLTLKRDHSRRWIAHVEGSVMRPGTGDGQLCMIDLVDVTTEQQTARELRESLERYRSIFESIQDVYAEVSIDGTILEVTPSIAAFSGFTRDEVLGKSLADFYVYPEERDALLQRLQQEGSVTDYEVVLRNKAGEHVICSFSVKLIVDADGKPVKLAGTMRDVTERKRLQNDREAMANDLRQAQKMEAVGKLAGGVAHDFNNLLMCIMGSVDLCRDEIPEGHPAREWLDNITADSRRSADLVRQLLAFARKQTIVRRVMDVNDEVSQAVTMLQRLIGEDIEVTWRPGEGVWPIEADGSQVDQVLTNLSVNARDAIDGVGEITIATENTTFDDAYCEHHPGTVPGDYVVLIFGDNGRGMDRDALEHVFEPFFTTKGNGTGTGMGLATVYGIVKQHEGTIELSGEPGKGTTFRIYFPRARRESVAASRAHDAQATIPKGEGTVLLVDDQPTVRRTTSMLLRRQGYTVLEAESPHTALRLSSEYTGVIDLLLTDVVMPGMNGRELAEALAEKRPDMKCIFMSGYTADEVARRGIQHGSFEFLSKPFACDVLVRKIHSVLGTHRKPEERT